MPKCSWARRGFPGAGGAAPVEVFRQEGKDLGHGEGLEGMGHAAAAGLPDAGEDLAVGANAGQVDDEGGGWNGHGGNGARWARG